VTNFIKIIGSGVLRLIIIFCLLSAALAAFAAVLWGSMWASVAVIEYFGLSRDYALGLWMVFLASAILATGQVDFS